MLRAIKVTKFKHQPETYSEPFQIPEMKHFANSLNTNLLRAGNTIMIS